MRGAAHEEFVCEVVDELADWDHLEDASLVMCISSTSILPIMIINRIYENQNVLSLSLFFSWSG